ncbi:MAG: DUF1828 domain-containing protein [Gemmatimonadaceae bacterium]
MNCVELADAIRAAPFAGWECGADEGFLRLATPFRYPDGGAIELYIEARSAGFVVTDFGEAFRFLETSGLDPLRSPVRERLIAIATKLGGAHLDDGVLEVSVLTPEGLLSAAARLGQVVTRIADLTLLAKGTLVSTFSDLVEEFIVTSTAGLEVRRHAMLPGNAARHEFDIVVRSIRGVAAIESLSAVTAPGATAQLAFTVQKFADLAAIGSGAPDRYAVLDNTSDVWTDPIRKQLMQFSRVIDWEERDTLASALTRA